MTTEKTHQTETRGERIFTWITERLAEGYTVYASTAWKHTKITARVLEQGLIRLHGDHCEVSRGKHWDSINYSRLTARDER